LSFHPIKGTLASGSMINLTREPLGKIFLLGIAVSFLCTGCIGPHYTQHEVIVDGKQPPEIHGPHDPAIVANLRTYPWKHSPLGDRALEVVPTIAKSTGIQGWKDYHMHAKAWGIVVQHEYSSNGFLTMDIRLKELTINHVAIAIPGPRYMRFEIFRGKLSVDSAVYEETNALVVGEGKFVWDSDGWFEIHPQKTGDVKLATPPKSNTETSSSR
jgi:hypothetical protein